MNEITPFEGSSFDDLLTPENMDLLQGLTGAGLTSDKSKVSYGVEVKQFVTWFSETGASQLSPLALQGYKDYLIEQDFSASKINLALSALRRMVKQANMNGLIPYDRAAILRGVTGVKAGGVRIGNWLTQEQAQQLLNTPNTKTLKGLRDRAILAVFLGAALRRTELTQLTNEHIQQREGRWVIVDIIGKRGKVRTVPIASWVKYAIDTWTTAAHITQGTIFKRMMKGGVLTSFTMTPQAVYNLVLHYSELAGLDVRPHDLRRTSAKLARNGGSPLEQISLVLGHESMVVTQRYLGVELDLHNSPSDHIDLKVNGE
jgi:integrase/recombinase XerD